MVNSRTVVDVLTQAVLPHPMLAARWRWNCNRALVVPRSRGGQRRPIHLQRMDADDLLAAAWPALAACQENADAGPIPVPDHVLVRQTVADCLTEPLDAEGLVELVRGVEDGRVEVHFVESAEPSVLAHGILTGRPYTFLDGAPLEERRSRAVPLRRGLGRDGADGLPVPVDELGPLDGRPWPTCWTRCDRARASADELHDLLLSLVRCRPVEAWRSVVRRAGGRREGGRGRRGLGGHRAARPGRDRGRRATPTPTRPWPSACRGHLELAGPVAVAEPGGRAARCPRAPRRRAAGRGPGPHRRWPAWRRRARPSSCPTGGGAPGTCWSASTPPAAPGAGGSSSRPASPSTCGSSCRWQHRGPRDSAGGSGRACWPAIEQLAGVEVPAGDWESQVLAAQGRRLRPALARRAVPVGRGGLGAPHPEARGRARARRRRRAPGVVDAIAGHPAGARASRGPRAGRWRRCGPATRPAEPAAGASADVLAALRGPRGLLPVRAGRGASGRLPVEVDEGLWDLVARGLVTADAFSAVRSLLSARQRWRARQRRGPVGPAGPGPSAGGRRYAGWARGAGRSCPIRPVRRPATMDGPAAEAEDELAEAVAWQLLARWGVVAFELWSRESYRLPWRQVVRALRRLEARGLALGGRFVAGLSGEQYAVA